MYTLGGAIDEEKGWGRAKETWSVREELEAYGADPTWFGLGAGVFGTLAHLLHRFEHGAGSERASHIQDTVAAFASANGLKGAIYGVIIVLFVLFEPLGLYGRWLKIKLFFQLFPLYKRATFKRQKIYVKSERNR